MTNEEINIAIAESLGWDVAFDTLCNITPDHNGEPVIEPIEPLPNYAGDLNACRDAFNSLNLYQQIQWHGHLYRIVKLRCADNLDAESVKMVAVNAPSNERAIAYVKTIGKWKQ